MPPNSYRPPPPPPTVTIASQSKKKKNPVLWDKDGGPNGLSSIRILLDWLTIDGNYQRWRGDTKSGSTKAALANEILGIMAVSGITHRDNKGIQTKIQELQNSYSKASDFLRNTGSGLQEEDIQNVALTKLCKYWDELHPIMGSRTVATPLYTAESTSFGTPDLTGGRMTDNDTNGPADPSSVPDVPPGTSKPANATATEDEELDPTASGHTRSPGPSSKKNSKKRKMAKKGLSAELDPLGLASLMSEANSYRTKCFAAREAREKKKRETERRGRRIRVMEMEAQMKIKRFESEEIRNRISYMKELKALGHSKKEIKEFFDAQYGEGNAKEDDSSEDHISESSADSSSESGDESGEERTNGSGSEEE
ncbi:uncharacterized protein PGTG_03499 [Puccinia graminis f. sp. tritici CRL 75-36-700-3]|uniref:Uncharacterized protein n=1 Tax=Puccinia graminis f. sp. tritici (strain CRL 75-36-700-3 / race SCCL) TaxID=418459 RepID=E3JZR8_PUCGT|nr:uncharacterized protein PGTG_03499 [Puccinia graminis f. sp. tritici CRL 75-36-700-3]EFP77543.2 hypothetical protein PGTG_03499 [Puccinia graminis f. sp. tritici CRL 75-36-700-3]